MTTTPPTTSFPLALRPTAGAAREPAAWFVPGHDPAAWLAEVARWGVPTADLRLHVLPASPADPTPVGVLVVVPPGATPRNVLRGQPFGRVAGKLYLPVAAELWPPVSEAELRDLLRLPVQVLHPSAGLVGFADEDVLRAHDLLEPPAERAADWGRAAAGESVRPRVVTVGPLEPPDVAGLLEQGKGDIGSTPPKKLPPTPDESALANAARRLGVAPAKLAEAAAMGPLRFMAWLQKQLAGRRPGGAGARPGGAGGGGGPSGKGWAERLHDWAAGQFAELNRKLQDQRSREIERLQRMLADDPDEGLRHAIALRDVPGRGQAPPSGQLNRRDVQFSLTSALGGGGGATDAWDVPPDAVALLRKRYLEAANRELRLGRYRRAAYVFAELLGDYAAAANALEQGRHHREAAVLYRDKLGNPAKAAECLERGGLLAEAAAAHEDLKRFEAAGDLYARIDRPDEAARCYRAQVDAFVADRNPLSAARLLEHKLAAADEALALLTNHWPADDAAGACLRASFDLLGRLAQHDAAADRVADLRQDPPSIGRGAVLSDVLAHVATGYPDQRVRTAGADATRVVAAKLLPSADPPDRKAVAHALGRLAPEDRLLARDVERFLATPAARPKRPAAPALRGVVVVRRFRLPDHVRWAEVVITGASFQAAGHVETGRVLARGVWDGRSHCRFWRLPSNCPPDAAVRLHPRHDRAITFVPPPIPPGTSTVLPRTDALGDPVEIVSPTWLPPETLAIGNNDRGVTWALAADPFGLPVMKAYGSADGRLIASHGLQGVQIPPEPPTRLAARHDVVFAAWGSGVLRFIPLVEAHVEPTPSPVRRLAVSPPHARLRVAAALEDGGMLIWHDRRAQPFAQGLADPHVAFTRGGALVAADRERGRVYRTDTGDLRHALDFGGVGPDVIALTPTDHANQFAAFTSGGQVTVYQLPG